jgi:fructose-bisphosphate aldolase class II
VKEIKNATGATLVLHGGSGLRDEDFTNAIRAGISIVHINSELRLASRDAINKIYRRTAK